MKDIKKIDLGHDVGLMLVKTDKFKSNIISVYIHRMLDKSEASMNAVIPAVLTSGCEKYPSMRALSDKLDDLYGASLVSECSKRGERQLISLRLLVTNDRYIDDNIFIDTIEFLNEVVNHPLVVDGGFKKEYVEVEKNNLKNKIVSIINDKRSYAHKRCLEEMCKGERYGIGANGTVEDVELINAENLYGHYKKVMEGSRIDIVVEGNFDFDETEKAIKEHFKFENRGEIQKIEREEFMKTPESVKNIEESMDITQGKLVMGYRTNTDYKDAKKYYSLITGCGVLGGGPHSKLFANVREKESLCYYIFANVEKYKGIMMISSGIEFENREKTERLINENLQSVLKGDIDEKELYHTKKALINGLRSSCDGIGGISEFEFSQQLGGTNYTVEEIIDFVEQTTVEDIVEAMKDIVPDTVYFLRD